MTADESRQVIWDALAEFDRPVSVKDVAERVGKSEQLTRARLNELYTHGRASRQGTGRWIKYVAVRERKSA
jgi:predicted ArsR family transcriptional regulator